MKILKKFYIFHVEFDPAKLKTLKKRQRRISLKCMILAYKLRRLSKLWITVKLHKNIVCLTLYYGTT